MKKKIGIAILGTLLVAGGISVCFLTRGDKNAEPSESLRQEAQIPDEILRERGPRPETERFREGAKQIETKTDARAELQLALARVSGEIEATSSTEELKRLEHKRALIMRALKR